MDFDRLDMIAQRMMKKRRSHRERETGHVYYHGRRVMNSVILLRRQVTDDASHDDLLRAAGLFHDCGKGIEPHEVSGALLVREFLNDGETCTPEEAAEISRLVSRHDLRGNPEDDIWVKLLQDADLMDHMGTSETWLNFHYMAYVDRPVSEAVDFYKKEYPDCNLELRKQLNFDCSRAIFDEKHEFTMAFIKRLAVEAEGGYVGISDQENQV